MGNFWDTLQSVGMQTIERVSAPVSSALGRTFSNIVQGTQQKVQAVTDKIVRSTDPIKNANSPAIPPTTGSTANTSPMTFAGMQIGVLIAAVLVVLIVYFIGKRGT
jgi:hypothetical protein